jgi:DNA ligase-1
MPGDIELEPLYCKNKSGGIQVWRVYAEAGTVITEHGVVGGKLVTNRVRCKPTNVGRANARDEVQQAIFEATSAHTEKKKAGYFTSITEAQNSFVLLPMLAHPLYKDAKVKGALTKVKREVNFTHCWAQRKYNGLRCLSPVRADGVQLISRQGTLWDSAGLDHIRKALLSIGRPGDVYDGELYIHGVPLQTLNSYIKRNQPETAKLQYVLYDMPIAEGQRDGTFEERFHELRARLARYDGTALLLAPTKLCTSEAEVHAMQQHVVFQEGYEGLIIRQAGFRYEFGDRSESLIKYKTFQDAEFEIIDSIPREWFPPGSSASLQVLDKFVCKNDSGDKTFEVVPRGDMAGTRREYWTNRGSYIGQKLVVRFLERSIDGIPQGNPVGIAVRLPEDTPEADSTTAWSS